MRVSKNEYTWEVWRALRKLNLLSVSPRATLTLLFCSPNFPRVSEPRYTRAKHESVVKNGAARCTLVLLHFLETQSFVAPLLYIH